LKKKRKNHNFAARLASRTASHFQATVCIVFFLPAGELHFLVLKCVEIILKFPSLSVITFGGL